ncbi:hypothetical protein CBM2626_A60469 [Cupriavidus taiwanensis]|uniref:Alpha/beta hydrolase n=1 Tax=Cupriavidus taiwanensis TaxID=164546 RepID=A0A976AU75_9BURK|nr:hypothetical protein CBM2615_A160028 [Cupriavidus taiwanensis]SOZ52085.1 hypothetical protein CBM2614_A150027 [Cupriavidus taiwanensis]SOZ54512.1 hypothetical protein CBM2613_A160028 [Cupriavidus taiwanensis]SPA00643.1 hypothetical protein CBM2626_A60469 [Cupriavidus taiwanensis]SPA04304.1 hypothetical protein CBM2625_A120028 [Cupriavidus taiwanensis]
MPQLPPYRCCARLLRRFARPCRGHLVHPLGESLFAEHPRAGHWLQQEAPDFVNSALIEFLRDL